jgi:hypothetical protein
MWKSVLAFVVGLILTSIFAGAQGRTSAGEQYGIWKQKVMSRPGNHEGPSDQQFAAVVRRLDAGSARADLGVVGLNTGYDISVQPLRAGRTSGNGERCERVGGVTAVRARGAGYNVRKVTEERLTFPAIEGANAVEIRVRLDTPWAESQELGLVLPLRAEAQFGVRTVTDVVKGCEIVDGP